MSRDNPNIKQTELYTLRDLFAAAALSGLMVNAKLHPGDSNPWARAPKHAYEIADAMLEVRKNRK